MTPDFSVRFVTGDDPEIIITDTSTYTGVSSAFGYYRFQYPDGVFFDNNDPQNPDFTLADNTSQFALRSGGIRNGIYKVTQRIFTDIGGFTLEKTFTVAWSEPVLILNDNTDLLVPTVSFLDTTDYVNSGYTLLNTRQIICDFPANAPAGTLSTVSAELFMLSAGNYYEGVYEPSLVVDAVYTGAGHIIQWQSSKDFSFDVRKFLGYEDLVSLMNLMKQRVDQSKGGQSQRLQQLYTQLVSLYSHITGKISVGEYDITDLIKEMQKIAYEAKCICDPLGPYIHSSAPLVAYDPQSLLRFPFIDEVIYREWNSAITFSQTSTIFFRVENRIRWFKSRQGENLNNPVFIDGDINEDWWEEILLGADSGKCFLRSQFAYGGGPQEFTLNYSPESVFQLFINGLLQDSSTYSLTGYIVTITGTVLSEGAFVTIIGNACDNSSISDGQTVKIEVFEYIDNKEFTLEFPANNVFLVFVNGQFITSMDYSTGVDTVTVDLPLIEGDEITVYYMVTGFLFISEAPVNGRYYGRRNQRWEEFILDVDGGAPDSVYMSDQILNGGNLDG